MKKLLALALVAAASTAHAYTVDATVNWSTYDSSLAATGASGTLASGQLLNDNILKTDPNKTSFGANFTINAAPVIAGYTFDHIEWLVVGSTFAGGSATSANPSGSIIRSLSSNTYLDVGVAPLGFDIGSISSTASGSFVNAPHSLANGGTLNLGDDEDLLNTGWFTSAALSINAFASAADTFTSDGNSDASFSNYANVGAQARYVYTQDPPVTVPEPASMALVGLGMMGLAAIRRRK